MLEIFLVIGLCKRLGRNLRAKGRSAVGLQIMLVLMWFGLEFAGLAFGFAMAGSSDPGPGVYLFGLAGAIIGGLITFAIAGCLSPVVQPTFTGGFPVTPISPAYPYGYTTAQPPRM